ncbi:Transketolase, N-terminal section (EC [Olavius sp. associated proteobacterium Delta 1]|nr:Transketolase, N-terminal section (EC [Olavius sp. associated proteobacterium Delta 1]
MVSLEFLQEKANWVKKELLKIHKIAPGIRLASSLSCIEILTTLYYGKIVNYDPKDIFWEERDRFIISKAHGSVSFYPILADLGYFDRSQLALVGKPGGILADIPDCSIPGYETLNGSLGHGLGVACGICLALRTRVRKEMVFVLMGDGELHEGSVWEAIMFAAHHKLDNLTLIIDNNKICMLDYCKNIVDLEPIEEKFRVFGWQPTILDGHSINELHTALSFIKQKPSQQPSVIIANTIKGKGVPRLETDSLCHIKALSVEEIDQVLMEIN